jgi:hypothetical protein
LGTVTGTVLLVGAKYGSSPATGAGVTSPAAQADPAGIAGAGTPGEGTGAGGTGAPPNGPNAAPAPGGSVAGKPAPTGTRTTGGATARPTTPAAPAAPAAPACTTVTGDPANVSQPGTGAVTVTIKACGGAITTASGTLSQSNWSRNTSAIPALNTLAVQYYKTDFSQIHYSGASLTSAAYQASLRSAMTKAKV